MFQFEHQEQVIGAVAMRGIFQEKDLLFTNRSITNNINKWYQNKNFLMKTLQKHPDWNQEALAIIVEIRQMRDVDLHAAKNSLRGLFYEANNNMGSYSGVISTLESLYEECFMQKNLTEDAVNTIISYARDTDTELPIHPSIGMKSSRFILKTLQAINIRLEDSQQLNRYFSGYTDAISPLSRDMFLVISVNPGDYLTMSDGNSWTSCQAIGDEDSGCYQAGTLSYMMDSSTVVAYVVPTIPADMRELCSMPKHWRQLFLLHETGKMFIQSRLYPGSNREMSREIRRSMHSVMSSVHGFTNSWKAPKHGDSRLAYQESDLHYADYHNFSDTIKSSVTVEMFDEYQDGNFDSDVVVGGDPKCVYCGMKTLTRSSSLYCYDCREAIECDDTRYLRVNADPREELLDDMREELHNGPAQVSGQLEVPTFNPPRTWFNPENNRFYTSTDRVDTSNDPINQPYETWPRIDADHVQSSTTGEVLTNSEFGRRWAEQRARIDSIATRVFVPAQTHRQSLSGDFEQLAQELIRDGVLTEHAPPPPGTVFRTDLDPSDIHGW